MSNVCTFSMKVVGEKSHVESFVSALEQKGKFCMGRGGLIKAKDDFDGGSILEGEFKWSLYSSLIGDAITMREQKETGKGYWYSMEDGFFDNHEFITLQEASELFDVDVEAYSTEPWHEFAEHILVKKGVIVIDDSVPYQEIWFDAYANYEEFSECCTNLAKEYEEFSECCTKLAKEIGKQEFEELRTSGGCRKIGGFESTEFSI